VWKFSNGSYMALVQTLHHPSPEKLQTQCLRTTPLILWILQLLLEESRCRSSPDILINLLDFSFVSSRRALAKIDYARKDRRETPLLSRIEHESLQCYVKHDLWEMRQSQREFYPHQATSPVMRFWDEMRHETITIHSLEALQPKRVIVPACSHD
jgi:hypothetical protein